MGGPGGGGLREALGWLVFPVVPVLLADLYHGATHLFGGRLPPDPRDWAWGTWIIELGPLAGFAFLAGATFGVPDGPPPPGPRRWRRLRSWLSRRSVWVAVGPWSGFLAWVVLFYTFVFLMNALPFSGSWLNAPTGNARVDAALGWAFAVFLVATLGYAWLVPAVAAVRRAGRLGPGAAMRALRRGLGAALAFVGSLFGSFWALTEAWRPYFFDAKVVPALLAAASLGLLTGCSSTVTYGEVRRRELFHAMLIGWVFGLALLWRWWGRPRRK
jgi:hypothetical protein